MGLKAVSSLLLGSVTNANLANMPATTVKANTTGASASPSDVTLANFALVLPLRSYLAGLTLSTAGSSGTFGIAAGVGTDSTNAVLLSLASAYTKTTSAWAVGTGNGGLDTGSIANATWYHVYLIERVDTGLVDVIFSLSASAPTLPTNYTLYRRIGSMKTDGSAHWLIFTQFGDVFTWGAGVPTTDVNGVATTGTPANKVLQVPTGIQVIAQFAVELVGATPIGMNFYTPGQGVPAIAQIYAGPTASGGNFGILTDTSAQITAVASNIGSLYYVSAYAWIDTRGRNL